MAMKRFVLMLDDELYGHLCELADKTKNSKAELCRIALKALISGQNAVITEITAPVIQVNLELLQKNMEMMEESKILSSPAWQSNKEAWIEKHRAGLISPMGYKNLGGKFRVNARNFKRFLDNQL